MGQSQKYRTDDRSVFRRIGSWLAFWLVTISIFMVVGAPSEEKK